MVLHYEAPVGRAERLRNLFTLFLRERSTTKTLIHREIIMKVARILGQHLNRLSKH